MPDVKVKIKETYDDFEAEYPVHPLKLLNLPDFVSTVVHATIEAYQAKHQKSIDIHVDFDRTNDGECEEED